MELNIVGKMQSFIQKATFKTYFVFTASLLVLSIIICISYILLEFSNQKIYSNIKVAEVNVGGLSKQEAVQKLKNYYSNAKDEKITLKLEDNTKQILFNELNVTYEIKEAVNNAYKLGRKGGFFKRANDIVAINLNGAKTDISVDYNKQKLSKLITELEQNVFIKPKNNYYEIVDNKLVFHFGSKGRGVDRIKCIQNVEQKMKKANSGTVTLEVIDIQPEKFDADSIPNEPKDATYVVKNNREIKYFPEQRGVIFDKKEFNRLLKENRTEKNTFSIPVKIKEPEITVEYLKEKMFEDKLSSYQTYYGTSSKNRKANVKLAASKIGGVILSPGDEFSYNKIVGPRTPERGFKLAHVYSNGEVVDGYGGGICQVSSTLYNAALESNFMVTARRHHMFTVGYVPLGRDATVSYGSIDFKFINNKNWPIKIVDKTDSNNVFFKILGTELHPEKTFEYEKKIVKEIPYEIEKEFDPEMSAGETEVEHKGKNGYVVKLFKIVKKNGEVIKKEFLHKDSYSPLDEKVKVGTKQVDVSEEEDSNSDENNTNAESQSPSVPAMDDEESSEFN